MLAKGFLRFTPPERVEALKRGPGENGRTPAGEEVPKAGLDVEPWPLELELTSSLLALFLRIRKISAGRLKLGEYPAC